MSDNEYPDKRPPDTPNQLRGTATVENKEGVVYTIDFDKVECDCKHGAAWKWNKNRWVPGGYCNHKLKAVASLIEAGDDSLTDFYEKAVGLRHNAFVAVSAFHKELRRGDIKNALYWAACVVPHRGRHGVVGYMLGIVFEETRDLKLANYLLHLASYGRDVSELDMQRAVRRFCAAPKKWELPWRLPLFIDEQKAYRQLAKDYGYAVAKHNQQIDYKEAPGLREALLSGFKSGDRVTVQIGLKGWYKSKNRAGTDQAFNEMKIEMFNTLTEVLNGEHPNKFEHDATYCNRLHRMILNKIKSHGAPKYHELNALADALSTPAEASEDASLYLITHKRFVNFPRVIRLPLGDFRQPPLYAHDNHTWSGKALMRSYGAAQLQPGAVQDKLDFRLCGAYMGVAWRLLAIKQHGTIDVKWGDVSWKTPNWLWGHLENMFY